MSASTDVTNSTIIAEEPGDEQKEDEQSTLTTLVGYQLCTDYQVYELPSETGDGLSDSFPHQHQVFCLIFHHTLTVHQLRCCQLAHRIQKSWLTRHC